MIARLWRGFAKPGHADAYEAMLQPELLPGIGKVKGFRRSYLLRRPPGEETAFIHLMLIASLETLHAVTRPDFETAVVPEARRQHLARYDAKSLHYEIVSTHEPKG